MRVEAMDNAVNVLSSAETEETTGDLTSDLFKFVVGHEVPWKITNEKFNLDTNAKGISAQRGFFFGFFVVWQVTF